MIVATGISNERDIAPNNGMHPTRDTLPVINLNRAGGRVMPGVRRRYDKEVCGPKERGRRITDWGSRGVTGKLRAA